MLRRTIIQLAAAAVLALAAPASAQATGAPVKTSYAPVNGLQMYYEIHGEGGTPQVLIHGAFSAIGTSFSGRSCPSWPGRGR